jgi:hypothetical protein
MGTTAKLAAFILTVVPHLRGYAQQATKDQFIKSSSIVSTLGFIRTRNARAEGLRVQQAHRRFVRDPEHERLQAGG